MPTWRKPHAAPCTERAVNAPTEKFDERDVRTTAIDCTNLREHMRYIAIRLTDPQTNEVLVPNLAGKPGFSRVPYDGNAWTYSSLKAGAMVSTLGGTNMAAQRVEMDIPVSFMHEPVSSAFVRIWGVSLAEISQSADLNGLNISIFGGFAKGLPLANPLQSGRLASGQILQAFGNWIGNDQSLDLYMFYGGSSPSSNQTTGQPATNTPATTVSNSITAPIFHGNIPIGATGSGVAGIAPGFSTTPLPATNDTPANLTFQWKQGQKFLDAVVQTLAVAFPKYTIRGAVSPNIVWSSGQAVTGYFATLTQFAQFLNDLSQSIIGGYAPDTSLYSGVSLVLLGNEIIISDGTTQTNPTQIQFLDLIGQPTWSQPFQVQVTCAMRADIAVGNYVTLPTGPGITKEGAQSQFYNPINGNSYATQKSGSVFTGTFQVVAVRHVGDSRSSAGTAWVTTLDLIQVATTQNAVVGELPVLYAGSNRWGFYLPN